MRIIIAIAMLSGCLVESRRPGTVVERREVVRSCPPAHHWDDGRCVHNGHGHGDHDRD